MSNFNSKLGTIKARRFKGAWRPMRTVFTGGSGSLGRLARQGQAGTGALRGAGVDDLHPGKSTVTTGRVV